MNIAQVAGLLIEGVQKAGAIPSCADGRSARYPHEQWPRGESIFPRLPLRLNRFLSRATPSICRSMVGPCP